MPRSHSSYTASPTRYRSPQRSPTHHPTSEEGSQYEVDLDALGLNSTFDSSGMEEEHAPKVDVVDTSDIGGPEDFTMNMTYWMTADLPISHIKSRKEAHIRVEQVRGDATQHTNVQDATEEGDRAVLEDTTRDRVVSQAGSASPTLRVKDGGLEHPEEGPSVVSMENDEKVMSYLSALPDTDLPGAITSTPLKVMKGTLLQVPTPAGSKARSLQATVEDYETPRKPTQETVIHHIPEPTSQSEMPDYGTLQDQLADLQARLEQQELRSRTRVTELETILSYTRSELDAARTENFQKKEVIAALKSEEKKWRQEQQSGDLKAAAVVKQKEQELEARIQEFGEEMRLQNLTKLQSQREEFDKQLRASEENRKAMVHEVEQRDQLLHRLRSELDQIRQAKDQQIDSAQGAHVVGRHSLEQDFAKEREDLNEKLSALQARAEGLQSALEKATRDAENARKQTQAELVQQPASQVHTDAANAALLERRVAEADGRIEGLEATISALRQQLTDARRERSKAQADVERLESDLEAADERLEDARREADRRVADVEKKLDKMKELKIEAESRLKDLQSEHASLVEDHEAQMDDVRSKAEDAVRKVGAMLEAERSEKRRLVKDLKRVNSQLEKLKKELEAKPAEESDSEGESSILSAQHDSKEVEISNLRTLVKKQASDIKALKSESASLRKKSQIATTVHSELDTLRTENHSLTVTIEKLRKEAESQRADFEAINREMDERLAAMLTKMLKERSKAIVGKRDDQWAEGVGKLKGEKELMGKVLMREWGRQECGVAEEQAGEKQLYRYRFVTKT